jgi:hypothetical protein
MLCGRSCSIADWRTCRVGMLTPLLDQNRDGSVMDDLTMIGRFMKQS